MGLEFKHLVYVVGFGAVLWAVAVSAIVSYEDVSASVALKGELEYERVDSFFGHIDRFEVVRQVLNVILPLSLLCIGYLAYTYRINPIGLGSMVVVVLSFLFAADSALSAMDSVEREFEVEMSEMVWWMPEA